VGTAKFSPAGQAVVGGQDGDATSDLSHYLRRCAAGSRYPSARLPRVIPQSRAASQA
jgi:hypothetical protein